MKHKALQEFWEYLKAPSENVTREYEPKAVLGSVLLYFMLVIGYMLIIVAVYFVGRAMSVDLLEDWVTAVDHYPIWIVALIGPVIEELWFRLALVRKEKYLLVFFFFLSLRLLSDHFFAHEFWTLEYLLPRLAYSTTLACALFIAFSKILMNCKYGPYFYISAILFGLAHYTRINFDTITLGNIVLIILYFGKQTLTGLILGYIRMKNGFNANTAVHMLNNLLPAII